MANGEITHSLKREIQDRMGLEFNDIVFVSIFS